MIQCATCTVVCVCVEMDPSFGQFPMYVGVGRTFGGFQLSSPYYTTHQSTNTKFLSPVLAIAGRPPTRPKLDLRGGKARTDEEVLCPQGRPQVRPRPSPQYHLSSYCLGLVRHFMPTTKKKFRSSSSATFIIHQVPWDIRMGHFIKPKNVAYMCTSIKKQTLHS